MTCSLSPLNVDKDMNLIIQCPVFIQPYTQKPLILYQLETVPVPILDQNTKAQSYTYLSIKKPYIVLNFETYISLRQQEHVKSYEFYCEKLFVVKHKSSYSCESAIYFNLTVDIIKNNCNFDFYLIKQMLLPPYQMEEMKLYRQIGQMTNIFWLTEVFYAIAE